jgi:uncharacterized membrane protein
MFRFPRAVWLLGWVSLATDAATEAIYPLLPWQGIGAFAASALFGVLWKAFGAATRPGCNRPARAFRARHA